MEPEQVEWFKEQLKEQDELTVLELLDLKTDDLVNKFKHKIKLREEYLERFFSPPKETQTEKIYGKGITVRSTFNEDWVLEEEGSGEDWYEDDFGMEEE